jgi:hypothetical protein
MNSYGLLLLLFLAPSPSEGQQAADSLRTALATHPILFVVRGQYASVPRPAVTIFQKGEIDASGFTGGSALKVLDAASGVTRTLVEVPEGIVRDPDVDFSGEKIVFSLRRTIADDYHIYEINADGSGMKQLTSARGVSDIEPFWLPDGGIAFSSTREPKYDLSGREIMTNLFRMTSDGANIYRIGSDPLSEGHGSLMPDGRILYDSRVNVDRDSAGGHALWTVYPDGTNHALYWGADEDSPGAVLDARIIPGTQQAVCILGSSHDLPRGALAIIDRRLGLDGARSVIRTWPADAASLVGRGGGGSFLAVTPKYEDPFPLDDRHFLCSRTTGDGGRMGIYLVDTSGAEALLHAEGAGCFDPIPLAPRPRPTVIPARRNFDNADGRMYVVNVYTGTHMAGVAPGTVKYLRVVETLPKSTFADRAWGGSEPQYPAMNWLDPGAKRILGTVPVEEDGSAFFLLPSDRFVYFQLLDENGMMVQSMRSGTMIQSGELAGCMGCHEDRRTAPLVAEGRLPRAMQRDPSALTGFYGDPRPFSYMRDVQPVFDRNCVRCHDWGAPAGKVLNLAPDRTLTFNVSYTELWLKKFIAAIGAGPAEIRQPYSWGSHASTLVKVITGAHHDVTLDRESIDRIVTWIDLDAPYYPAFETAYPENLAGRSPLDDAQLRRLTALTGVNFAGLASHDTSRGPEMSFDRPPLSPCLSVFAGKNTPAYREALGIIEAGKKTLLETPRADMDGFALSPADRMRDDRFLARRTIELRNRKAIKDTLKVYDDDMAR